MAAETSRKPSRSVGLVVRPHAVSDKSYVESVVGFINEVVPQAKSGEKESVSWVKFEYCDINDFSIIGECGDTSTSTPPLLVVLGYANGVQIWYIPANGEAQEVFSWRQGPVKILKILPTPSETSVKDKYAAHRPMIAVCDSFSAGEQFSGINFVSLRTGDRADGLKFSTQVSDLKCNKRVLAVVLSERIIIYDVCNLKEIFTITSCYSTADAYVNPIALGPRWLAFADRKLVSVHQTCGGMAGDGVQSYAATVIHAAKTITKGLTMFGETVANSFTSHKPSLHPSSQRHNPQAEVQPGIVTILDIMAINTSEINLNDDEWEGIVAHFPAHANEPVAAMSFDHSGMLLFTSCRLGHNFNVFRIFPHPAGSTLGAVHHLYTLHRGDTTAKVQDIAFSLDSRWVAVSTLRGTTHIFPITPYGGQITVRTHTSPRVVNRLSRFHRSAGLEEIQHPVPTGRNSPVLSASPSSSGSLSHYASSARAYDSHPSLPYPSNALNRMGNARLPPYPHPVTVNPLSQLRHTSAVFPLATASKPKSPSGKDRFNRRTPSGSENVCVAATFAPPRGWLVSSPSLTRDKRENLPSDSLYTIDWHGSLVEYVLEPRPSTGFPKTDDSPIEMEATGHAQWDLLRPASSPEIQPPLAASNPLMSIVSPAKERRKGELELASSVEKPEEPEESWLSQVEIITHAGPHRRLWMGPQFSFQTFQHHSNTTVLSSSSSALLSQSPSTTPPSADIFTEELDVQSLSARPARSNPMAMPGSHQAATDYPGSPLLIEASSGSFEQLPNMLEVCGSWPEGCVGVNQGKGKEEQLKECIADAMAECPFDYRLQSSRSDTTELHGSYEELSSSSSASGSACHLIPSSPHCSDHTLVFPPSENSPDSS